MMTIKLLVPDMPKTDDLLKYLKQIDSNCHYTNFGPLNTELENRLKNYFLYRQPNDCDNINITTVANATLGLEVLFSALNLPKNSNVLIPSLTFPATATAAVRQGLTPIFSTINPDNWLLTPEIAREAIKAHPNIKLIVPVATFGLPVNVEKWDLFIEETGIPVVIDAAGAFSNQLISKKTHIVFSLHATKTLGGGEGGFIVTNDKQLVSKIRIISNFGIEPDLGGKIFSPGTNAKMSEYHAAVTLASLDRWEINRVKRLSLLTTWLSKLSSLIDNGNIEIQSGMENYAHSLLPLRFKNISDAAILMEHLAQKNIQTRRWYYPLLHHQPAFSFYKVTGDIKFAEKLSNEILGMPFHLDLKIDEVDYIADILNVYFETARIDMNAGIV